MKHGFSTSGRVALSLTAVVLIGGAAAAQSTGSPYPYWGTAPESYRGSQVTVPVPGMSPNTISNAARSSPAGGNGGMAPGGFGSGIGGAYLPPFLTAFDAGSSLPAGKRTGADTKAHIWLRVPTNAEVWVDGVKTKQSGATRYFFSPPLTPGRQYSYSLRIRWKKDGKPVEETQRVLVHSGATIRRDFTQANKAETRR